MTHDLVANLLRELGAELERVVITDLRDNTFYAVLELRAGEGELAIDSRPSDAIALAVRLGAPIFVEPQVLEKSAADPNGDDERDPSAKKSFDQLDPDDYSNYQM